MIEYIVLRPGDPDGQVYFLTEAQYRASLADAEEEAEAGCPRVVRSIRELKPHTDIQYRPDGWGESDHLVLRVSDAVAPEAGDVPTAKYLVFSYGTATYAPGGGGVFVGEFTTRPTAEQCARDQVFVHGCDQASVMRTEPKVCIIATYDHFDAWDDDDQRPQKGD